MTNIPKLDVSALWQKDGVSGADTAADLSVQILSNITTYMKYARYLSGKKRRETWEETVTRNKEMHLKKYPALVDQIEEAYKLVYAKKVLPSMRSLQFAGKSIDVNNTRIFNCSYLPVDHPDAFSETTFLLLSGTGVGYSVQPHHIEKLPPIFKPSRVNGRRKRYLVGDSIEGWADAVKVLVESYFHSKQEVDFDFRDIRPKGAELITSGGKAPGPEPLRIALANITAIFERAVAERGEGTQLKSIEAHDIQCHIADAVLAGGIRRAAMIAGFSPDDYEMLECKMGSWWEHNPQRGRANNSAIFYRPTTTKEQFDSFWEKVVASGSGEPGVYWSNDPDMNIFTNPCVSGSTIVEALVEGKHTKTSIEELSEYCAGGSKHVEVKTRNLDTGEVKYSEVTAIAKTKKDAEVVKVLDTETGKHVICTPDHQLYTKNRGWVRADELKSDDLLDIL